LNFVKFPVEKLIPYIITWAAYRFAMSTNITEYQLMHKYFICWPQFANRIRFISASQLKTFESFIMHDFILSCRWCVCVSQVVSVCVKLSALSLSELCVNLTCMKRIMKRILTEVSVSLVAFPFRGKDF